MTERQFMVGLEERLYADASGDLRRDLVRQLTSLRDDLLARRRQLHAREVYFQLQAALSATEGALSTLHTLRVRRERL
jgi:hypothetical protein